MVNGVDGLISGLPTGDIIESSIEAAQAPARLLESKKVLAEAKLEAVRTLNLRSLSARLDVSELRRGSTFDGVAAESSNTDAVDVQSTSSAVVGSYSFSVDQLATSEQRAAAGVDSTTASNGSGILTLQVGSAAATTIDFSSGASSLEQMANAINNGDHGITAFVIDDGSASASANKRLVLQSQESGKDQTIKASGSGDLATLFGTDSSNMTLMAAGKDAELTLGEGAGAIGITSSSNSVDNVIPGVTLELKDTASQVTVTVGVTPAVPGEH